MTGEWRQGISVARLRSREESSPIFQLDPGWLISGAKHPHTMAQSLASSDSDGSLNRMESECIEKEKRATLILIMVYLFETSIVTGSKIYRNA